MMENLAFLAKRSGVGENREAQSEASSASISKLRSKTTPVQSQGFETETAWRNFLEASYTEGKPESGLTWKPYNPHSGKNLRSNTKNFNNINQLNSFLIIANKNVVHKNPGNLSLKINELRIEKMIFRNTGYKQ